MKEKNIKMNNMDLNEKKLIIDPLRRHISHMKDWEVKKNLFEDNLSKAYESVINKFAIIDICYYRVLCIFILRFKFK